MVTTQDGRCNQSETKLSNYQTLNSTWACQHGGDHKSEELSSITRQTLCQQKSLFLKLKRANKWNNQANNLEEFQWIKLCCQLTNLGREREREFSDRSSNQMHNSRYKPRLNLTESTATAPGDIWILVWSLAWSQQILLLHLLWWWWCICSQARSIQNLLNKLIKAALHIDAGLGTSLKEQASMFAGESNSFFLAHSTFGFFQIHFVADQHLDAILVVAVSLHFLEPYIWQIRERRSSCHIVHQYHSLCSSVIRARQRPEPFLSRCVPDRELQPLPLQRYHLQLEIYSYCRRQIVESVGCETEKQTALTDSRIADQEHLEEMIELPPVSCRHRYFLRPQTPTHFPIFVLLLILLLVLLLPHR